MATKPASTFTQDDFGNECAVLHAVPFKIEAVNAAVRFMVDGCVDGIVDGILEGEVDEDCLKFFGLV